METGSSQHSARRISRAAFLKDVFLCSLGSYGGPEAHYGVFSSILVQKRKYLTEEELTEMIGLTEVLLARWISDPVTTMSSALPDSSAA